MLKKITVYTLFLAVMGLLTACGGEPPEKPTPETPESTGGAEVTGTFTPEGPPVGQPVRMEAGASCIVDVKQAYTIDGTLSGSLEIDYRIIVDGPCGSAIGTYDERWIAKGIFDGTLSGDNGTGNFSYTANVRAGGDVQGKMVFGQGLEGELNVSGNFNDGSLAYRGWMK